MKKHQTASIDFRNGAESIAGRAASSSGTATSIDAPPAVEIRSQGDRFRLAGREEIKLLAKAEALVAEGERCVSRQTYLITELRAGGLATLEAEKSLTRLEALVIEQRTNRDAARRKADAISEMGA